MQLIHAVLVLPLNYSLLLSALPLPLTGSTPSQLA